MASAMSPYSPLIDFPAWVLSISLRVSWSWTAAYCFDASSVLYTSARNCSSARFLSSAALVAADWAADRPPPEDPDDLAGPPTVKLPGGVTPVVGSVTGVVVACPWVIRWTLAANATSWALEALMSSEMEFRPVALAASKNTRTWSAENPNTRTSRSARAGKSRTPSSCASAPMSRMLSRSAREPLPSASVAWKLRNASSMAPIWPGIPAVNTDARPSSAAWVSWIDRLPLMNDWMTASPSCSNVLPVACTRSCKFSRLPPMLLTKTCAILPDRSSATPRNCSKAVPTPLKAFCAAAGSDSRPAANSALPNPGALPLPPLPPMAPPVTPLNAAVTGPPSRPARPLSPPPALASNTRSRIRLIWPLMTTDRRLASNTSPKYLSACLRAVVSAVSLPNRVVTYCPITPPAAAPPAVAAGLPPLK